MMMIISMVMYREGHKNHKTARHARPYVFQFLAGLSVLILGLYRAEGIHALKEGIYESVLDIQDRPSEYDVIIIGGGGGGCVAARTFADAGQRTLLIERGGLRENYELSLDINGAGIVLSDERIVQPIITSTGVRSHVASVLGGGTSVSFAIYIEEGSKFIHDYAQSADLPGLVTDEAEILEAMKWVREQVGAVISPNTEPYFSRLRDTAADHFGPFVGHSPVIETNGSWNAYSLFDSSRNGFRRAADVVLGIYETGKKPKSLDILVKNNVVELELEDMGPGKEPRAKCVIHRATATRDILPLGVFGESANGGSKVTTEGIDPLASVGGSMLRNYFKLVDELVNKNPAATKGAKEQKKSLKGTSNLTTGGLQQADLDRMGLRRTCVTAAGKIIVSAGALFTPILLMKSGIGPAEEVMRLPGVKMRVLNNYVGKNLVDRPVVPVGMFLKEGIPPQPPRICQTAAMARPERSEADPSQSLLDGSWESLEEISGGKVLEGFVAATRIIVPPQLRTGALVDVVAAVFKYCMVGEMEYYVNSGTTLSPLLRGVDVDSLCKIVKPIFDCGKRAVALYYMLNNPKSRGSVTVDESGKFVFDMKFFREQQDLDNAATGIGSIFRLLGENDFSDVFEMRSPTSCPFLSLSNEAIWLQQIFANLTLSSALATVMSTETDRDPDAFLYDDKNFGGFAGIGGQIRTREGSKENTSYLPYATFPVIIPDPTDPDQEFDLRQYCINTATSMWHYAGSMSLGKATKQNFEVRGVSGLYVVDASTVEFLTRMNPTSFIMAWSRYASNLILDGRAVGQSESVSD